MPPTRDTHEAHLCSRNSAHLQNSEPEHSRKPNAPKHTELVCQSFSFWLKGSMKKNYSSQSFTTFFFKGKCCVFKTTTTNLEDFAELGVRTPSRALFSVFLSHMNERTENIYRMREYCCQFNDTSKEKTFGSKQCAFKELILLPW